MRCVLLVVLLILGLASSAWTFTEDVLVNKKLKGDYDQMLKKRVLRVLTPYN